MQPTNSIPWRTRSDLTSVDLGGLTLSNYAVKDQIKNEFFNFGELEFFILKSLRQSTTVERLIHTIKVKFGVTLNERELVGYLNRLAGDNLLVAHKLGDGERLYNQYHREQTALHKQRLLGLLSVKLPGFYPGALLQWLRPLGWLCFHPLVIFAVVIATIATATYAAMSLDSLVQQAPGFAELISPSHVLMMLVGFVLAKIVHELGHALACQRVGHECSEMGMMLLVFLPVLYCDVSDLWTEKSRAKRILVSLAGVLVELAISVACFWGWYFSLDGQLNRFLFSMMLVTSVNTLFINGNPLMRYDGYYALSDWVRIPNLASVSRDHLNNRVQNFFVRHQAMFEPESRGWFLGSYAIASLTYRWMIMFAIGWAIWAFFDSQQLASLGWSAVALILLLSILPTAMQFKKTIQSGMREGWRVTNVLVCFALIAFVTFVLSSFQFSQRVKGLATFELADAKPIFAPVNGQLIPCCVDGQLTNEGDLIAKIVDEDLLLEQLSVAGELQDVELRLATLKFATGTPAVAGEIEFWSKRQQSLLRRQQEINDRIESLEIVSPIAGQVVVNRLASTSNREREGSDLDLSALEGDLFGPQNAGCHVKRGDNLCYVAETSKCNGYMEVGEREIELVRLGNPVRVFLPHSSRAVQGVVTKISLEGQRETVAADPAGAQLDLPGRFYRVEFELAADSKVRVGSVHQTAIVCRQTTPLGWLQRWWRNSIWF